MARYPGFKAVPLPGGPKVTTRMIRDNFKRYKVAEEEVNRTALRYISRNTTLPMRVRLEAQLQLSAMPHYTCETQIKDRCVESGYSRSIITDFRVCRVCSE
jgi:small subunit ribosomal protein S14